MFISKYIFIHLLTTFLSELNNIVSLYTKNEKNMANNILNQFYDLQHKKIILWSFNNDK